MVKPTGLEEANEFARRWERWTRIVGLFARRPPIRWGTSGVPDRWEARLDVDPAEYRTLHTGLLQFCRARAREGEPAQATRFRQLEEILAPWVSVDSLALADRVLVCQLLGRCTQVQRVLGAYRPKRSAREWARPLLLGAGVLVAAILLLLAIRNGHLMAAPAFRTVYRWAELAGSTVAYYGTNRPILATGTTVVLATIILVCRSSRRTR